MDNSIQDQLKNLQDKEKEYAKGISELSDAFGKSVTSLRDMRKSYESISPKFEDAKSEIDDLLDAANQLKSSIRDQAINTIKEIKNYSKGSYSLSNIKSTKSELLSQLANLSVSKLKSDHIEASKLKAQLDDIVNVESNRDKIVSNLKNNLTNQLTTLSQTKTELTGILGLHDNINKATSESNKLDASQEKIRSSYADRIKNVNKVLGMDVAEWADKAKEFTHVLTTPKALLLEISAAGVEGFKKMANAIQDARQEGETFSEALGLVNQGVLSIGRNLLHGNFVSLTDALEAQQSIIKNLGSVNFNQKITDTAGKLISLYNVSAASAGELASNLFIISKYNVSIVKSATEYAKQLSVANHVAPGEVFEELASNASLMSRYGADNVNNLIRATVQARKLGLEIGNIDSVADNLLDYDTSLQKTMEASVLIGKNIDFTAARTAFLNNNMSAGLKDLKQELQGIDFSHLNRIQQNALAGALGMPLDQLVKLINNKGAFSEGNAAMGGSSFLDKLAPVWKKFTSLTGAIFGLTTATWVNTWALRSTMGGNLIGRALSGLKGITGIGGGLAATEGTVIAGSAVGGMEAGVLGGVEGAVVKGAGMGMISKVLAATGLKGFISAASNIPFLGPLIAAGGMTIIDLLMGKGLGKSLFAGLGAGLGSLIPGISTVGSIGGGIAAESLYDSFFNKKNSNQSVNTSNNSDGFKSVADRIDNLHNSLLNGAIRVDLDGREVSRNLQRVKSRSGAPS